MENLKAFRRCLGKFATGVTVVTCVNRQGQPCGITANSFSSVSLEPPLVLWNIAKVSNSIEAFLEADHFAINILSAKQQAVSVHFAQSDHTVFDGFSFTLSDNGVPLLADTLASLECSTTQTHEAGDHFIIIGKVDSYRSVERQPLLFFDGGYTSLA